MFNLRLDILETQMNPYSKNLTTLLTENKFNNLGWFIITTFMYIISDYAYLNIHVYD